MKPHALSAKVSFFFCICSLALLSSCMFFLNTGAQDTPALRILLSGSNSRAASEASVGTVPTHSVDYYLITLSSSTETVGPAKYAAGETATFAELTAGTWKITVEAWFQNALCGIGTAEATVVPAETTNCAITLEAVVDFFATTYDSSQLIMFLENPLQTIDDGLVLDITDITDQKTGNTLTVTPENDVESCSTFKVTTLKDPVTIVAVTDYGIVFHDEEVWMMLLTEKGHAKISEISSKEDKLPISNAVIKTEGFTTSELQDAANQVMSKASLISTR